MNPPRCPHCTRFLNNISQIRDHKRRGRYFYNLNGNCLVWVPQLCRYVIYDYNPRKRIYCINCNTKLKKSFLTREVVTIETFKVSDYVKMEELL